MRSYYGSGGFSSYQYASTYLNESIAQHITARDSELLSLLQNNPILGSASSDSNSSNDFILQEHQANAASTNEV